MKSIFKSYIYLVPIILLGAGFVSNFYEYTVYESGKYLDYVVIGNCFGWSILADLVFIHVFYFNKSYCWATRLSPFALLLINLVDIIGCFIDYQPYSFIFNIAICFVVLLLSIIFELIRRFKNAT